MKVLVIGSCTKSKRDDDCPVSLRLTDADFENKAGLRAREQELTKWLRPAAEMYTGRQHTQMMDGVRLIRSAFGSDACDVAIVSAGYGLLSEQTRIAPYDITFHRMGKPLIKARGEHLGISAALRDILPGYFVIFVLLGDDYLLSIRPPLVPADGQKFIAFGSPRLRLVPGMDVVVIPAEKEAAQEFHAGIANLKGKMFSLFATGLVREPEMWNGVLRDQTPQTVLTLMRIGERLHEPPR